MQGPQSSAESGVVVDMLAPLFEALGITDVDVVTTAVRKGAHVCEYAVLGVLAWGLHRSLRPAHGRRVFLLVLMVVFVPVCDEAIQLFVPGRSGRLSDVFVDLAGLCLGAFLAAGLSRLRSRARA